LCLILLLSISQVIFECLQILSKMRTTELIKEIQRLPMEKRILVIEKSIHSIRKEENSNLLKKAAVALYPEYKENKELTDFSTLDFESFYETR
jgi:uncharacterized protein YjgD (DUF1641 family)